MQARIWPHRQTLQARREGAETGIDTIEQNKKGFVGDRINFPGISIFQHNICIRI